MTLYLKVGGQAVPVTGGDPFPITPWTAVTFENSWVNYGAPFQEVEYRRFGDNVQLRGVAKDGTAGTDRMFTLPVGFRPPANAEHAVRTAGAPGGVLVTPDGSVIPQAGASTSSCWVTGSFSLTATGEVPAFTTGQDVGLPVWFCSLPAIGDIITGGVGDSDGNRRIMACANPYRTPGIWYTNAPGSAGVVLNQPGMYEVSFVMDYGVASIVNAGIQHMRGGTVGGSIAANFTLSEGMVPDQTTPLRSDGTLHATGIIAALAGDNLNPYMWVPGFAYGAPTTTGGGPLSRMEVKRLGPYELEVSP